MHVKIINILVFCLKWFTQIKQSSSAGFFVLVKTYCTKAERFVLIPMQCRFSWIVVHPLSPLDSILFPFYKVRNSSVLEKQMKSVSSNVFSGTGVIVWRTTTIPDKKRIWVNLIKSLLYQSSLLQMVAGKWKSCCNGFSGITTLAPSSSPTSSPSSSP